MAFAATNIQARQAFDARQHRKECGCIEVIAIDVVAGAGEFGPGLGAFVPIVSCFFMIHLIGILRNKKELSSVVARVR